MLWQQVLEMSCSLVKLYNWLNTSKCSFHTGDVEFFTVRVFTDFAPTNTKSTSLHLSMRWLILKTVVYENAMFTKDTLLQYILQDVKYTSLTAVVTDSNDIAVC